MEPMELVHYHGEHACEATYKSGEPCRNRAYFSAHTDLELLLCAMHAKVDECTPLPRRDAKSKAQVAKAKKVSADELIEQARAENVAAGRRGAVALCRMRMMKAVPSLSGYRNVFPNNRHENRKDGIGCAALSPMRLGPVQHGQPGLPDARNIENYWQSSKCFAEEADKHGGTAQLFYANRLRLYEDETPHRYKYRGTQANSNVPLYFVWVSPDGEEHHLSYVESRQFYCTFYDRLARQTPEYARLEAMLADGYNLQLCGYDAHPVGEEPGAVERAYLDASVPFGHERVLYAMLTCPPGQEHELPWKKHVTFARHLQE